MCLIDNRVFGQCKEAHSFIGESVKASLLHFLFISNQILSKSEVSRFNS